MWLNGVSASLWTKGSQVQFPVRAHAWVAGQVPSKRCMTGDHALMFLFLSFSLPSSLKKINKIFLKKEFFWKVKTLTWYKRHYRGNSLPPQSPNLSDPLSGGTKYHIANFLWILLEIEIICEWADSTHTTHLDAYMYICIYSPFFTQAVEYYTHYSIPCFIGLSRYCQRFLKWLYQFTLSPVIFGIMYLLVHSFIHITDS